MTDDKASANVYNENTPYQMGSTIPWAVYRSSGMALPGIAVLPSAAQGPDYSCYVYV